MSKRAFLIQSVGQPASDVRVRADRVLAQLIDPACQAAGYEPVRADRLPTESITRPIVSALFSDPIVIADLAAPPWNPNVMVEVGFRLSVGRSLIVLADMDRAAGQPPTPRSPDVLPLHLRDRRILWIDPADPSGAVEDLTRFIDDCRGQAAQQAWESQYAYVDFRYSLDDPAQSNFTYVNDAAARIYGYASAEEMLGQPVDEIDRQLCRFMDPRHWQSFLEEQGALLGVILNNRRGQRLEVLATVPLWFIDHAFADQRNKVYLPLLMQHRYDHDGRAIALRTVYIDITTWAADAPQAQAQASVVKVPAVFRKSRKVYQHDLFLPYDSPDAPYMTRVRELLDAFDCTVWYGRDGAERTPARDLLHALAGSRMAVLVLGRRGLGRWEQKPGVRDALLACLKAKKPHMLLLLPEIDASAPDPWKPYVPDPYQTLFAEGESLYLPLPEVDQLAPPRGPQGRTSFLERIVRELFKVLRQLDD